MANHIIPRPPIPPGEEAMFVKFNCPPTEPSVPNPNPLLPPLPFTPDMVPPNRTFHRSLLRDFAIPLPLPAPNTGDSLIEMWIISDRGDEPQPDQFPSPLIRAVKGEIVHTVTTTRQGTHTIHHHGLEPTPCNDGVGKSSFEVGDPLVGQYTYQWLAAHAGTYFYHCHKNTVLHFEMGLYGGLIIDPPRRVGDISVPNPPYPPGGPGFVSGFNPAGGDVIRYDVEKFWVVDEFDSLWHRLVGDHGAFMAMCPPAPNDPATFTQDGFLNDFRPDVFLISGAPVAVGSTPVPAPSAEINAVRGQTILIRLLNAGYTVQQYTLGLNALVIGMDGRPLGVPPYENYSRPFTVPAGRPFRLSTARRWELIIQPTSAGRFPVSFEFFDWVSGRKYATAQSAINVS